MHILHERRHRPKRGKEIVGGSDMAYVCRRLPLPDSDHHQSAEIYHLYIMRKRPAKPAHRSAWRRACAVTRAV